MASAPEDVNGQYSQECDKLFAKYRDMDEQTLYELSHHIEVQFDNAVEFPSIGRGTDKHQRDVAQEQRDFQHQEAVGPVLTGQCDPSRLVVNYVQLRILRQRRREDSS